MSTVQRKERPPLLAGERWAVGGQRVGSQELVAHVPALFSEHDYTPARKGRIPSTHTHTRKAQRTRVEKCRLAGARRADGWRRRREGGEMHRGGFRSQALLSVWPKLCPDLSPDTPAHPRSLTPSTISILPTV